MNDDKFRMPAGPGINLAFDSAIEAVALAGSLQSILTMVVQQGALLRLDAALGEDLMARSDGWSQPLKADGWYGTIDAIGFAVGPFLRKSFAMNGLVLALAGLPVEPVEAAEPPKNADVERIAAELVAKGVPEDAAKQSAEELLERVGPELIKLARVKEVIPVHE